MKSRAQVFTLLWLLYFVQGLPFGFQVTSIPLLLRERGASLFAVTLSGALALPWLLKPFLAPLVDSRRSPRWGARRGWILPLQALLMTTLLATGAVVQPLQLTPLMALVILMNLCAAVMDIAVDGLAIDLLRDGGGLGHGNAAQVVGYKLGMLTGGGLLLWASARVGMAVCFVAMAAMVLVTFGLMWRFVEPTATQRASAGPPLRGVLRTLLDSLRRPGAGWLVVVVLTYKLGESMADRLFKLFVFDAGFDKADVGLWVDGWGMAFSIAGSLYGGWLATRRSFVSAVMLAAGLRVLPIAAQWWLTTQTPTPAAILTITSAEHFFGGALTTTMFALMMARVDPRIGATHYTALAALEVLGKVPGGWFSGWLGDRYGYPPVFALATLMCVVFLGLLVPLARSERRERALDTPSG